MTFKRFSVILGQKFTPMNSKQLLTYFITLILTFFLQCVPVFAQESARDGMANMMYESGKIYVVIGTILLIFIGMVIYLFALDRKIRRMEDEM